MPAVAAKWNSSHRSAEQSATLSHVVDLVSGAFLRDPKRAPVVTFDLDSTLFDNRPRQLAILGEFARAHGLSGIDRLRVEEIDGWRLVESLPKLGGFHPEMIPKFKPFWRDRFFTSEFCAHDAALPGAPEYVHSVERAGAKVVYLTGRHEAMREGTAKSLATNGFPTGTLLVKPTFEMTDTEWKEIAVPKVHAVGSVVACFDNETTHVNRLKAAFPGALVVWIRTDHSPEAEDLSRDTPAIDGFLR